ncbi:MAG: MerR family transcriptional regulator [Alphaproteobacteria bacterium]
MTDAAGAASKSEKSASAFRTISEVSQDLDVPQHVLRFWETKFTQVKPLKRAGGRRYYRPEDVALLRCIRDLLYSDGFTIRGVQKRLREKGAKGLVADMDGLPAEEAETASSEPATQTDATSAPSADEANSVDRVEPSKVRIEEVLSAKPSAPVSTEKQAELMAVKDQLEALLLDVRTARRSF